MVKYHTYNLRVIGKKYIGISDVYDIKVENADNYLMNGLIVNCGV